MQTAVHVDKPGAVTRQQANLDLGMLCSATGGRS